jgi:hypothetical protein
MMPIPVRRKRFGMEKVENLYRTARAQNNSTNTSEQIRSRLRDSVAPTRGCEPCELAKALGSVRAARECHRRAIVAAAKIVDWIFSYRVRRRSGAARGAWTSAGRSGRVSRGLRPASEQSVQMRLPLRSSRPAERPQPLPEMSHFGAEFFRMLRKSGGRR